MTSPAFHRFLDLDETERTAWVARFLENSGSRALLYNCPFPILRAGEQPFTWLIDQFRRVKWLEGFPGRIRRPVVELIVTEGGRHGVRNRPQLLGELLEVAAACGFTEVAPSLRAWVRDGRYREDWYEIFGGRKAVRLITWSILIGWRETEGLIDSLMQDVERTDLGCAQLCFAELGRLAPGEAIERIPATFAWPELYRREVLLRFLVSLGPRQAVSPRYEAHWKRCIAEILGESQRDEAAFGQTLSEAGISYRHTSSIAYLWTEVGEGGLEIAITSPAYSSSPDHDLLEEAYARVRNAGDPEAAAVARKQVHALQKVEAEGMLQRGLARSFLPEKQWLEARRMFERAIGN